MNWKEGSKKEKKISIICIQYTPPNAPQPNKQTDNKQTDNKQTDNKNQ
jgi:hypothetical protein